MKTKLARTLLPALTLLGVASNVWGDTNTTSGILHIRLGYMSGHFSSSDKAVTGSFSVPTTVDAEYEMPRTPTSSLGFRFTMAHDISQSRTFYMGTTLNGHYYFLSSLTGTRANEGGLVVTTEPLWRLYVGWSAGLSNIVAQTLGQVYQADSTLIEGGAHVGAIYRISGSVGIDAQISGGLGYGFSNISVGAFLLRALAGVAISF